MASICNELTKLADLYERFATDEARSSSPIYEHLAMYVAQSKDLLNFIATLPAERQQPNLFLAAVRSVCGIPNSIEALDDAIRLNGEKVRDIILTHTTQTNEPARCAVLLPILATLPQPLALLEVGASAGLCLLPDRYAYDYGDVRIEPSDAFGTSAPVFSCVVNQETPLPQDNVTVVWRAGLDLNPLNVRSVDDMTWLEALVWPEHVDRASHLKAAIEVAKTDPPRVVTGNLLTDVGELAALAPSDATLVVYHTAVLNYVRAKSDRDNFAAMVQELGAVWISNEAPDVFQEIAKKAPSSPLTGQFLLAMNGTPIAWTAPHGQSLHWLR